MNTICMHEISNSNFISQNGNAIFKEFQWYKSLVPDAHESAYVKVGFRENNFNKVRTVQTRQYKKIL